MVEKVVLRIAEALQADVGHGKARISNKVRKNLKLSPGDIIQLNGEKSETAAIVWRSRPEDENKDIIRVDGMVRKNANVSLGDKITIQPAKVKPAVKAIEQIVGSLEEPGNGLLFVLNIDQIYGLSKTF